jgi:hypothetical protein
LLSDYENAVLKYCSGSHMFTIAANDTITLCLRNTVVVPAGSFILRDYSILVTSV